VVLTDPRYDDKGPGTYTYPSGAQFVRGTFDLREVELRVDRDELVLTITFDAPIVKPVEVRRGDSSFIALENNLYLQNADVYVDTAPGGFTESVPGRNVRFAAAEGWEHAIVFSPMPAEVRSALAGWKPASRVFVPDDLVSRGSRVIARVPLHIFGGAPSSSWGYQVLITGASWETSFDAVPRVLGEYRTNAYTMRVVTIAENAAFGGGDLSIYHPAVIDALAPPERSQSRFLGGFDVPGKQLATVPMIYPDPSARPRVALEVATSSVASSSSSARIRSIEGEMVVLEKPGMPVPRFTFGTITSEDGELIGRVVVTAEYPDFLLAQVVQGAGRFEAGAVVRFESLAPPKK
jgi:hypothetical protein